MKRIKITAAIAVLILALAAFALTGCNEELTAEEGREALADGIEGALASDVYYIKYRINDMTSEESSEEGKYVQYSLNVQGGSAKFTVANGSLLKTTYDDTYYGKSLKEGVSSKDAKAEDYVTGKLSRKGDAWEVEECTLEEFVSDGKVAPYNMESVTSFLSGLTADELQISAVTRTGKVTYITAKVVKEGNTLAKYDTLEIRLIYDKLAYIGDLKESFNISISYGGPNINVPAWTYHN